MDIAKLDIAGDILVAASLIRLRSIFGGRLLAIGCDGLGGYRRLLLGS